MPDQRRIPTAKARKVHRPHLSTAQDPRAVRTRQALRSALLQLLETQPLEQITIRDIAATAGIGYVTFFRHHPTKEALLHEIAAEEVRRLSDLMLPSLDALDACTASLALCKYVDDNRKLWSTLLTGGAAAVLRDALIERSTEVAATRSDPNSWLLPELAIRLNVTCTIELLSWWLRQQRPVPIDRVAQIQERVVMQPTLDANDAAKVKRAAERKTRRRG